MVPGESGLGLGLGEPAQSASDLVDQLILWRTFEPVDRAASTTVTSAKRAWAYAQTQQLNLE